MLRNSQIVHNNNLNLLESQITNNEDELEEDLNDDLSIKKMRSEQDIIWEYFANPEEKEEEQLQEKWFEDYSTNVDSNSFNSEEKIGMKTKQIIS